MSENEPIGGGREREREICRKEDEKLIQDDGYASVTLVLLLCEGTLRMNTHHRGSLKLHPPFVVYLNVPAASGVVLLLDQPFHERVP